MFGWMLEIGVDEGMDGGGRDGQTGKVELSDGQTRQK